jgi:hypothetical protein
MQSLGPPAIPRRTRFKPDEDRALTELVYRHGVQNWHRIASLMPRRNARQCRDRWNHYLVDRACADSYPMNPKLSFPVTNHGPVTRRSHFCEWIPPEMQWHWAHTDGRPPQSFSRVEITHGNDPQPDSASSSTRENDQKDEIPFVLPSRDQIDPFSLSVQDCEFLDLFD